MSNERILRACRFFALPNRELWVSTDLREAFSYEAADGHDTPWLNQHLADRPPRKEFWFYLTTPRKKLMRCAARSWPRSDCLNSSRRFGWLEQLQAQFSSAI